MANTRNQQRTPASGSRKRGKKQPLENRIDVDSNTAKEEESSNRVSATTGGHSDSPLLKKRKQIIDVLQELVSTLEQAHSEVREIKKILKDHRSGTLQSSLLPPPLSPADSTVTTADVAENEGDAQSVMI